MKKEEEDTINEDRRKRHLRKKWSKEDTLPAEKVEQDILNAEKDEDALNKGRRRKHT